jgi:hypothetical protein
MLDGKSLMATAGSLLILLAWMVVGWIIAIKTHRWE